MQAVYVGTSEFMLENIAEILCRENDRVWTISHLEVKSLALLKHVATTQNTCLIIWVYTKAPQQVHYRGCGPWVQYENMPESECSMGMLPRIWVQCFMQCTSVCSILNWLFNALHESVPWILLHGHYWLLVFPDQTFYNLIGLQVFLHRHKTPTTIPCARAHLGLCQYGFAS